MQNGHTRGQEGCKQTCREHVCHRTPKVSLKHSRVCADADAFAVQEVPRRVRQVPGEVTLPQLAPGASDRCLEMRWRDLEESNVIQGS